MIYSQFGADNDVPRRIHLSNNQKDENLNGICALEIEEVYKVDKPKVQS